MEFDEKQLEKRIQHDLEIVIDDKHTRLGDVIKAWITASDQSEIEVHTEKLLTKACDERSIGTENVMRAIAYVARHL
jgi:hypothetical protein